MHPSGSLIPTQLPPLSRQNTRSTTSRARHQQQLQEHEKKSNTISREIVERLISPPPIHPLGVPIPPAVHVIDRKERGEVLQLLQSFEYFTTQIAARRNNSNSSDNTGLVSSQEQSRMISICAEEQAVYDQFFSEIIRQVSVASVERGLLLNMQRQHYSQQFTCIPPLAASLHNSVVSANNMTEEILNDISHLKHQVMENDIERSALKQRVQDANRVSKANQEECMLLRSECDRVDSLTQSLREQWNAQKEAMVVRIRQLEREREDSQSNTISNNSNNKSNYNNNHMKNTDSNDDTNEDQHTTQESLATLDIQGAATDPVLGQSPHSSSSTRARNQRSHNSNDSSDKSNNSGSLFGSLPKYIDPEHARTLQMPSQKSHTNKKTAAELMRMGSVASTLVHDQAVQAMYIFTALCFLREQLLKRYFFIILFTSDRFPRDMPRLPSEAQWVSIAKEWYGVDVVQKQLEGDFITYQTYPFTLQTSSSTHANTITKEYNLHKQEAQIYLLSKLDIVLEDHSRICKVLVQASKRLGGTSNQANTQVEDSSKEALFSTVDLAKDQLTAFQQGRLFDFAYAQMQKGELDKEDTTKETNTFGMGSCNAQIYSFRYPEERDNINEDAWSPLCALTPTHVQRLVATALPHLPEEYIAGKILTTQTAMERYIKHNHQTQLLPVFFDCSGWYGFVNWLQPVYDAVVDAQSMTVFNSVCEQSLYEMFFAWVPQLHLIDLHKYTSPTLDKRNTYGSSHSRSTHKGFHTNQTIQQREEDEEEDTQNASTGTHQESLSPTKGTVSSAHAAHVTSAVGTTYSSAIRVESPTALNSAGSQKLHHSNSNHVFISNKSTGVYDALSSGRSSQERLHSSDNTHSQEEQNITVYEGVIDTHHVTAEEVPTIEMPRVSIIPPMSPSEIKQYFSVQLSPTSRSKTAKRVMQPSGSVSQQNEKPNLFQVADQYTDAVNMLRPDNGDTVSVMSLESTTSSRNIASLPPHIIEMLHNRENEYKRVQRDLTTECEKLHQQKVRLSVRLRLAKEELTRIHKRGSASLELEDTLESGGNNNNKTFLTGFEDNEDNNTNTRQEQMSEHDIMRNKQQQLHDMKLVHTNNDATVDSKTSKTNNTSEVGVDTLHPLIPIPSNNTNNNSNDTNNTNNNTNANVNQDSTCNHQSCNCNTIMHPTALLRDATKTVAGTGKHYLLGSSVTTVTELKTTNLRPDPQLSESAFARQVRALVSLRNAPKDEAPIPGQPAILEFCLHVCDQLPLQEKCTDQVTFLLSLQKQRYGLDAVVYRRSMSFQTGQSRFQHQVHELAFFADVLTGTVSNDHFLFYTRLRHSIRSLSLRNARVDCLVTAHTDDVILASPYTEWASVSQIYVVLKSIITDTELDTLMKTILPMARPFNELVGPVFPAKCTTEQQLSSNECTCTCAKGDKGCKACAYALPLLALFRAVVVALDKLQIQLQHHELAQRQFASQSSSDTNTITYKPFAVIMGFAQPSYTNREIASLFVALARQNGTIDCLPFAVFAKFICEQCCSGVTFVPKAEENMVCDPATKAVLPIIKKFIQIRPMVVAQCNILTVNQDASDSEAGVCLHKLVTMLDKELANLQIMYILDKDKTHTAQDNASGSPDEFQTYVQDEQQRSAIPQDGDTTQSKVFIKQNNQLKPLNEHSGVYISKEVSGRLVVTYRHQLDVVITYLSKYSYKADSIALLQNQKHQQSLNTDSSKLIPSAEDVGDRVFTKQGALSCCLRAELGMLEEVLEHRFVHLFSTHGHSEACMHTQQQSHSAQRRVGEEIQCSKCGIIEETMQFSSSSTFSTPVASPIHTGQSKKLGYLLEE